MYKLCFCFVMMSLLPTVIFGQFEEDRTGLTLRLGFGVGYSQHADSYEEYFGHTTKQYDGFQMMVIEGRLGYRILNNIEVFGKARLDPADSIISPYRSRYLGAGMAYYLIVDPDLSLYAGYGNYNSNIKGEGPAGTGNMLNAGFSFEFGSSILFDLNIMKGSLPRTSFYSPNPFTSDEFNITIGFAFRLI